MVNRHAGNVAPHGFTVVESVVALMLLGIAVVTTLGVAPGVVRQLADSRDRRVASVRASSLVDSLLATSCARAGSASGGTPGTESWTTVADSGATRLVTVRVVPSARLAMVERAALVRCAP